MTPKQSENIIDNILSGDKSSKYYIHRTAIGPVFYDVSNGKLYTSKEYYEMSISSDEGYEYVDEYLYPIKGLESELLMKNHSLDVGAGWSIPEQEYKEIAERNFQEHISDFFEKGLYAVETSIERTATSLEEGNLHQKLSIEEQREKLKEILSKVGFGMNTSKGNSLLGALANREELNTLLILEIPESCLGDLEHISQLFEKSGEVFETETAYRGILQLDTIIPREYIKGAFFIGETDIFYDNNEYYDCDKKVENGIYNSQTINEILSNMKDSEQIQSVQIKKILEIIKSDYSVDNDVGKLNNRMSTISELLVKVEDKDAIEDLNTAIEEIYESIRNPLEKEYRKIQTLDFSQLSSDEVAKYIQDFVLKGSDTLKELLEQSDYWNYNSMFELYRKGLEKLSEDALAELSNDYRANNANAMVKGKLMDIDRVLELSKQIEPLEDLNLFGELEESDRETYNTLLKEISDAKAKVCENSIVDLEKNAFLGGKIGKATINISTAMKDKSQERVKRDELEVEILRKGQENAKEN